MKYFYFLVQNSSTTASSAVTMDPLKGIDDWIKYSSRTNSISEREIISWEFILIYLMLLKG